MMETVYEAASSVCLVWFSCVSSADIIPNKDQSFSNVDANSSLAGRNKRRNEHAY